MTDEQHIEFLETVSKSPADIVISSYENSLYDEYLLARDDWRKVLDKVKLLAGHSSKRQETIYMNYDPEDIDHKIADSIKKKIEVETRV